MLRFPPVFLAWLGLLAGATSAPGGERPLESYSRVEIATAKTSIYLGSVTMRMPPFIRHGDSFESTYAATVLPFFFSNEKGRLQVDFSDEMLRRLERGEVVEFNGRAVSEDGAERRVEGKATPADARGGKIKVRVFVSKRIELIFNTTYRFPEVSVPAPEGAASEAVSQPPQPPNLQNEHGV